MCERERDTHSTDLEGRNVCMCERDTHRNAYVCERDTHILLTSRMSLTHTLRLSRERDTHCDFQERETHIATFKRERHTFYSTDFEHKNVAQLKAQFEIGGGRNVYVCVRETHITMCMCV